MQMQSVQSSQINAIGYAPATHTMRIEFKNGGLYEYSSVPPEVFEEFSKAKSVGSHFYKHIKPFPDKYPYVKLEANKAVDAPAPEMQKVDPDLANTPTQVDKDELAAAKAIDGGKASTDAVHRPTEPVNIPDPIPDPPGGNS